MARQLSREVDQVLHKETHSPSGYRRDLSQSAGVKVKGDVLGPGEGWSPFLNPRQRSTRTQMLIHLHMILKPAISTSVLSLTVMLTKGVQS